MNYIKIAFIHFFLYRILIFISKYVHEYTANRFKKKRWCCVQLKELFCVFYDSLEGELESLRDTLQQAKLDTTPPKTKSESPGIIFYILLMLK